MARFSLRRLFRGWLKTFRLSVFLACVFALLSLVAARALNAQVEEAARAFGRQLADLPDLTRRPEVIALNGARVHHSRVRTRASVGEVLDRFEAHCKKNPGVMAEVLADLESQHPKIFEQKVPEGSFRNAVVRNESKDDGVVICFVDDRATGLAGVGERLEAFARTSDVSVFGDLRYAFAERRPDGSTLVVTMWSAGPLNVSRMFPGTGDADGSDSRVLPRPPAARRTLSVAAEGMPYALRTYESTKSRADLERFYDHFMKLEGWIKAATAEKEGASAYFRKDGYQVIVTLFEDEGRTYVSLLEAGADASTPIATVDISESP